MTKLLQHSALTRDVPKGCCSHLSHHSITPGTIFAEKKKVEGLKAARFLSGTQWFCSQLHSRVLECSKGICEPSAKRVQTKGLSSAPLQTACAASRTSLVLCCQILPLP